MLSISCFISDIGVFFGAFLGPILLVIVFNTVIYSLVIRVLVKHTIQKKRIDFKKSSFTVLEVIKLILSICGIMFLFGLTWIFAIFTFISPNRDISFALQFVFAFFNAFQGFWICLFFVFLNSEARESWKALIFPCAKKKVLAVSKTNAPSENKYFKAPEIKLAAVNGSEEEGSFTKLSSSSDGTIPYKSSVDEKGDEELIDNTVEDNGFHQETEAKHYSLRNKKHEVAETELNFIGNNENHTVL